MAFVRLLSGRAILLRERLAQAAPELALARRRPRQAVQPHQIVFLGGLADRQAQPETALPTPPALPLLRQVAPPQLPGPVPLQVAEGHQARLRPILHLGEPTEAVAVEAERPLQLLEEQLDLPAILPSKME